jgi:hypothetical protein
MALFDSVHEDIVRFQVTMHEIPLMYIVASQQQLYHYALDLKFTQLMALLQVLTQTTDFVVF